MYVTNLRGQRFYAADRQSILCYFIQIFNNFGTNFRGFFWLDSRFQRWRRLSRSSGASASKNRSPCWSWSSCLSRLCWVETFSDYAYSHLRVLAYQSSFLGLETRGRVGLNIQAPMVSLRLLRCWILFILKNRARIRIMLMTSQNTIPFNYSNLSSQYEQFCCVKNMSIKDMLKSQRMLTF